MMSSAKIAASTMLNEQTLIWMKLVSFLERCICIYFELGYLEQKEINFSVHIKMQSRKLSPKSQQKRNALFSLHFYL